MRGFRSTAGPSVPSGLSHVGPNPRGFRPASSERTLPPSCTLPVGRTDRYGSGPTALLNPPLAQNYCRASVQLGKRYPGNVITGPKSRKY
ncbi:hypothetical protein OJAV_G00104300 [Oryzias javanicus]|uniref:Uncharacterized protein n=1 Tax=Oryzias javanicus TaxID=123683 RepID=A0A437CY23_ORYJA|nr:hypothetical protein OJAV_G00104300 [Oryzias javanicus]